MSFREKTKADDENSFINDAAKSKMKDFGFSGSLDQPRSGDSSKYGNTPRRRAPSGDSTSGESDRKPLSNLGSRPGANDGDADDMTYGSTNPYAAGNQKMPANGGFAEGGSVQYKHPHGHAVIRAERGENDSAVQHHAHGGYSVLDSVGGITHFNADGSEASASGQPMSRDGGSVNAHPHGNAPTHTEHMPDREIYRHSHGGFSVHYEDGRPTTHHNADGTPVYHGGGAAGYSDGGSVDMRRGGHAKRHRRPRAQAEPMPAPMPLAPRTAPTRRPKAPPADRMSQSQPVNRPPSNPQDTVTSRNDMPGGQMPYGVQPSAEAPVSNGSLTSQDMSATGMKKGGRSKGKENA